MEAAGLAPLERVLGREFLRQILLGEAIGSFAVPLEVEFRGVVTDRREIGGVPYIEVAPSGLERAAFDVLGASSCPAGATCIPGRGGCEGRPRGPGHL